MALFGIIAEALGFHGLICALVNDARWANLIVFIVGALIALFVGGGHLSISAG